MHQSNYLTVAEPKFQPTPSRIGGSTRQPTLPPPTDPPALACTIDLVPAVVPMLDLARQYTSLRSETLAAIAAVLDAQHLVLGPPAQSFEQAAALACGTAHAVGCASGTDALWLALAAARIGPGDAVLTTPFSFFATVSAILRAGATPVLADIDPLTFNLSPAAAATAIHRLHATHPELRLRAILPVHLFGQCADMDALADLARTHQLLLIEDAAQAFGATWNGRPAGSLGDAAAFSFYPTKNLSAAGDAGLLTTNSDDLAERAAMLRNHGMRRRYTHEEVGWNARLDGIQAAVLSVKLPHLPAWNRRRAELAARYHRLLSTAGLAAPPGSSSIPDSSSPDHGLVLPHRDPRAGHVFHQYVLRVPRRADLREHLALHGIASEIYYPTPLHRQPALEHLFPTAHLPEAERAAQQVLALPLFPELREDEQDRVVTALTSFFA